MREALRGRVTRLHRFLLEFHLQQIDALAASIERIDQEVDAHLAAKLRSFRAAIELLMTIPDVSEFSATIFPIRERH